MATEDLLARDTIHASEKPLLKVFCDDYAFRIPAYQRPYSWDDEQVGQLLDDLVGAIDSDDPATNTPYFLGSIVLIKHPDKREADVVDGQQRLTTLTIIFAVLRDLAVKDRSKKVHKYICQEGDPFAGAKDQFRLTLRPRDAANDGLCRHQRLPEVGDFFQHGRAPQEIQGDMRRLCENLYTLMPRLDVFAVHGLALSASMVSAKM